MQDGEIGSIFPTQNDQPLAVSGKQHRQGTPNTSEHKPRVGTGTVESVYSQLEQHFISSNHRSSSIRRVDNSHVRVAGV